MVAPVERLTHYRYKLADIQYEITGTPVQNEYLEGAITRSLDVELYDEPTLATNLQADLYQDIGAVTTPQFKGHSNRISASAFPHRVVITNVGPLARLRQCPTRNHNLTGMTDGAAVRYILFHCNINFVDANIQSNGYTLGEVQPIYWLRDMPGAEMIAELDRVFGMATIEIENGIILRFPYDRVPDEADITKTYTVGVDAEVYEDQRDRGDLDAITNIWQVGGLSWTSDDEEGITSTIWARGEADNAAFNPGDRNRAGSFQSDIIQSQSLAEYIATRLMRWWNRQPDEITVVADNDISVRPGTVIGLHDDAYGLDLTAGADENPYLVLTVDRRGDDMTLHCVGGEAGAIGTVTSGIEEEDEPNESNPPDFEPIPDPTPGACVLSPADATVPPSRAYGTLTVPVGTKWIWVHGTITGANGEEAPIVGTVPDQGYYFFANGLRRWILVPGTATESDPDSAYTAIGSVTADIKVGSGPFESFVKFGDSGLVSELTISNVTLSSASGDVFSVSDVCFEFLGVGDWPY